ncbi:hypothetical protein M407DRAFT_130104 [Tulasnella calospora MUT 4182]|uniref:Uncharacterized protein n=1 Tax=Tulasnella calospora MUT 4182 TaxID=1051891 RepID=A0A0C3LIC6_9AGAM|nr:hypothetical protein M407DRAFT_130104 [Tulasnella calospora MUT 4182]
MASPSSLSSVIEGCASMASPWRRDLTATLVGSGETSGAACAIMRFSVLATRRADQTIRTRLCSAFGFGSTARPTVRMGKTSR